MKVNHKLGFYLQKTRLISEQKNNNNNPNKTNRLEIQ